MVEQKTMKCDPLQNAYSFLKPFTTLRRKLQRYHLVSIKFRPSAVLRNICCKDLPDRKSEAIVIRFGRNIRSSYLKCGV